MAKSLGDFNIEKSSSSDAKNITWSQKTSKNDESEKKNSHKKSKRISPTNIIYAKTRDEPLVEKVFVIEQSSDGGKPQKRSLDRKFENTSASNCNIKQGFKRPSR